MGLKLEKWRKYKEKHRKCDSQSDSIWKIDRRRGHSHQHYYSNVQREIQNPCCKPVPLIGKWRISWHSTSCVRNIRYVKRNGVFPLDVLFHWLANMQNDHLRLLLI